MMTCGLGCTAALWTVGYLTTPSPVVLAALLAISIWLGLALVAQAIRKGRAARRLRTVTGVAGGVCLAGSAVFLVALFRSAGDATIERRKVAGSLAGAPRHLRLVDLNVFHGFPDFRDQESRTRRLIEVLRGLDPTIAVLQEVWSTTRHGELANRLAAELDMDVAYARANGSRRLIGFEEGSAVLSRLPILEARRMVLSPRRPWWQTRIALVVTLALGEHRLTVVGTHLGGTPELAVAQTRELAVRLPAASPGLLIVAGDFNAGSGSAAVKALTARGLRDLVPGGIDHVFMAESSVAPEARERQHPVPEARERQHPVPEARPRHAVWRLVDAQWTLQPEDLPTRLSDHPGIVVDLAVTTPGDPIR